MPFIAILGCDGSGKSAVLNKLADSLSSRGSDLLVGHWRPRLLGNYQLSGKKTPAENPHEETPRNFFISALKLIWIWFNWWFEWIRVLRGGSRTGYLIFDRYHADLLVDPIRYRYGGSKILAELFCRIMPQPDLVFYLDAPVQTLLSRKREVSEESLIKAREAYLNLCAKHDNYFVIDAATTLNEVVHKATGILNTYAKD